MPAGRAAADYSGCKHPGIAPDRDITGRRRKADQIADGGRRKAEQPASAYPKSQEPTILCETLADWERWLQANHDAATGVWLKIAKKNSGVTTVTYPEVLEMAICHGWIDARRHGHDETFFLQRFTPRSPRSKWSQVNRDKALELIEQGRMREAGLAQVRAAQADGRWDDAYAPQSEATVPDDFQRALDANPVARDFFATLTGSRRYSFLYRLHHVKSPERRAQRIATYIDLLTSHRTPLD